MSIFKFEVCGKFCNMVCVLIVYVLKFCFMGWGLYGIGSIFFK